MRYVPTIQRPPALIALGRCFKYPLHPVLDLFTRHASSLYLACPLQVHIVTRSRLPFAAMTITLVPLSTVFTPPASCSSSWTYEGSVYNGVASGLLLQNAVGDILDTECFPPGYEGNGRLPAPQVFSPGACPHGYVTQSPVLVDAGVTTASCCAKSVLLLS